MKNSDLLKNKIFSVEEGKDLEKSPIAKIIEYYFHRNEKVPVHVLNAIDFTSGYFNMYSVKYDTGVFSIKIEETYAENLFRTLPFEAYKDYMDLTWLKTFKDDYNLVYSLIYNERYDVVLKFLDLIDQSDLSYDFSRDVFKNIFNIERVVKSLDSKKSKTIDLYFNVFNRALVVYNKFLEKQCDEYKISRIDIKNWHKNYEKFYLLKEESGGFNNLNLFLCTNKNTVSLVKEVFSQYKDQKNNPLLSGYYFKNIIKSGNSDLVQLYIENYLENNFNLFFKNDIKDFFIEVFEECIDDVLKKRKDSIKYDGGSGFESNIKEVYNIIKKFSDYEIDSSGLSKFVLVNDPELFDLVKESVAKKDFYFDGMNYNQWVIFKNVFDKIKESVHGEKVEILFGKDNCWEVHVANLIETLYPGEDISYNKKDVNIAGVFLKKVLNEYSNISSKNIDVLVNNAMLNFTLDINKCKRVKHKI